MERLQDRLKTHIRRFLDHPTGLEDIQVDDFATSQQLRSWERVRIPDQLRFSARLAIKLLLLFVLLIAWVPWTQTVTGSGKLSAYSPYERPQDIEAQIAGRILKWHVYEGVHVTQGDLILELQDVDPNFMAPDLLVLLEQSRVALEQTRLAALDRAGQLGKRITEMQNLVKAAVPSAEARVVEAENKVREAEQRVAAARIALETATLNVDRHRQLAAQGLVSQRELELAIQGAVTSQADLQSAQAGLKGAQQGMRALRFGRDQISADVVQRLLDAEASRAGALAEAARAADELASVNLRLSNATQRRHASRVYAPINGTVVRMAEVGPGETVRPGDKLVRLSPDSTNVAVELTAEGVDAPLLNPGRKVRLLFHGIPAIPLPAWPDLMAGTFGGEVLVVDRVADDRGNFRFWVIPDPGERCWPVMVPEPDQPKQIEPPCKRPAPGEPPGLWDRMMNKMAQVMYYVHDQDRAWPPQMHVRQGTKVMGWVILNRVPLWYEIWRRFNLFPPDYREGTPSLIDTLLPKAGRGAK